MRIAGEGKKREGKSQKEREGWKKYNEKERDRDLETILH